MAVKDYTPTPSKVRRKARVNAEELAAAKQVLEDNNIEYGGRAHTQTRLTFTNPPSQASRSGVGSVTSHSVQDLYSVETVLDFAENALISFTLKKSTNEFHHRKHPEQQAKLIVKMAMDDPQCLDLFREYKTLTHLISALPEVIYRDNVDDIGEDNVDLCTINKKTLVHQRNFMRDAFQIINKGIQDPELAKGVLKQLDDEFAEIFLEGKGEIRNNENKNVVGFGFFFAIDLLLEHHPDIEDEYKDMSITLLGRLSDKIDDKSFGKEGAIERVGVLIQSCANEGNHEKILWKIIGRMWNIYNE